jgi:hypothetical protein
VTRAAATVGGGCEVGAVGHANCAILRFPERRDCAKRERERIKRWWLRLSGRRAIGGQVAWQSPLEDPEVVQGDLRQAVRRHAKILGEDFGRRVRKPVGDEQRVEFVGITVIEADHELVTIGSEASQGMWSARREILS